MTNRSQVVTIGERMNWSRLPSLPVNKGGGTSDFLNYRVIINHNIREAVYILNEIIGGLGDPHEKTRI